MFHALYIKKPIIPKESDNIGFMYLEIIPVDEIIELDE